jgi:hypothetical protein
MVAHAQEEQDCLAVNLLVLVYLLLPHSILLLLPQ